MPAVTAVIFDMDGVILDSEPLHLEAANRLLAREGAYLSASENEAYLGWNEAAYWGALKERFRLERSPRDYTHERHDVLVELLREHLPIAPGLVPFLEGLVRRDLPLAVASSSERELIDFVLRNGDIERFFSVVVSGDEVERCKPFPDIFLDAARQLGQEPAHCVVLEDSVNGVDAARAAGMRCVRVVTETTQRLSFPPVDLEIEGFLDLDPDSILFHSESHP